MRYKITCKIHNCMRNLHERRSVGFVEGAECQRLRVLNQMCKTASRTTNHQTCHQKDIGYQIIAHNFGPSTFFKKFCGMQASICQLVPIQSNVRERPWIESYCQIVDTGCQTALDAMDAFVDAQ